MKRTMGRWLLAMLWLASRAVALEVALVAPEAAVPVFGAVAVVAEIYPPDTPIARIEVFVDGLLIESRDGPPLRFTVDVGNDNRAHAFEVVVYPEDGGAPASARVRTPRLETDLEVDASLRQLYVTVDRDGTRLAELGRDAFTVRDAGAPQRLVTFERGEVPFSAVLLVDASASMAGGKLATALAGARRFLDGMRPLDEAKLVLFADQRRFESATTNLPSLLTLGLDTITAGGGTAIHDALYLAFKRLEPRNGRKVVILLSDGLDIDSALSMKHVRTLARRSAAALYWIRLPRPGGTHADAEYGQIFTAWRDAWAHRRQLVALRETVTESGGRVITLTSIDQVDHAFAELLAELREQYVLGYYPSRIEGTGSWHRIEVDVRAPGVRVRTRAGYQEP